MPVYVVQAAWPRLLRDHLDDAAALAYEQGLSYLAAEAGVAERVIGSQLVAVRTLPLWRSGRSLVTPVRWEARCHDGGVFPALDANLGLTGVDGSTTVLSIVGRYEAASGLAAVEPDRSTVSRAAHLTVAEFLKGLGEQLLAMSVSDTPAAFAYR